MSDTHSSIKISTNSGSSRDREPNVNVAFLSNTFQVRLRNVPTELSYQFEDSASILERVYAMKEELVKKLDDPEIFKKVQEATGQTERVAVEKALVGLVRTFKWESIHGESSKVAEVAAKYTVGYDDKNLDDKAQSIQEMAELVDHFTAFMKAKTVEIFNEYEEEVEKANAEDIETLMKLMVQPEAYTEK